jgi:hypothetical protein
MEEFYKMFKDMIKPDLLKVFQLITCNPEITLTPLNDSYIVLIPKKENAM